MVSVKKNMGIFALLVIMSLSLALAGCASKDKAASTDTGQTSAGKKEIAETSLANIFAKNKEVKGMSFECKTTLSDGSSMEARMWFEGQNMRMETSVPEAGGNVIYIANKADKAMYLYQPAEKVATKMACDDQEGKFSGPQDKAEDVDANNAIYIGKEKLDGKTCLVYEVTGEGAKEKMWVWEEYGLPLRIETESEGQKTVLEYQNIKVGDVDDAMFQLPPDTQIMDMGAMTGVPGMPAMPQP